ncbi:hypothetical protein AB1Y20_003703 [Prymnesium parvum]|uniref:Uncharacterized protein n=1 Tax=Prymnesium parvum TaxID=97485 RepID=A0AB34J5C3_PRYPA
MQLDLANLVPMHARLNAAAQLTRQLESTEVCGEAVDLIYSGCHVMVASLLRAPEQLAEALVELLCLLIHASSDMTEVKLQLIMLAEAELCKHAAHWRPAALLSLLAMLLQHSDAAEVVHELCERRPLVNALVCCIGLVNAEDEHERQESK